MKLIIPLVTAALIFSTHVSAQVETMILQGKGDVRYLGFIKVYDAHLYTDRSYNGTDILAPEISKCLKLIYDVSLTPDNFIEGANTILAKQHPETILEGFKSELDTLHAAYQPVEDGDHYTLCYDSISATTTLSLNNSKLAAITSRDFSNIYFGIWLGKEDPLDEDLRDDLLTKKQ